MYISKNNISYFQAGYLAGLGLCKDVFYSDLEENKKVREYFITYDSKEFHDEGVKEMFEKIKKDKGL